MYRLGLRGFANTPILAKKCTLGNEVREIQVRKCFCELCKLSHRIRRTMTNGSHQQKNRLIQELANRLACAEDSLDYESCIADGSWPTAVEILEHRLERAREKRAVLAQK
jgi:hypothetical protein